MKTLSFIAALLAITIMLSGACYRVEDDDTGDRADDAPSSSAPRTSDSVPDTTTSPDSDTPPPFPGPCALHLYFDSFTSAESATFTYDSLDRLTGWEYLTDAGETAFRTELRYADDDRSLESETWDYQWQTPLHSLVKETYDELGRLLTEAHHDGDTGELRATGLYAYSGFTRTGETLATANDALVDSTVIRFRTESAMSWFIHPSSYGILARPTLETMDIEAVLDPWNDPRPYTVHMTCEFDPSNRPTVLHHSSQVEGDVAYQTVLEAIRNEDGLLIGWIETSDLYPQILLYAVDFSCHEGGFDPWADGVGDVFEER